MTMKMIKNPTVNSNGLEIELFIDDVTTLNDRQEALESIIKCQAELSDLVKEDGSNIDEYIVKAQELFSYYKKFLNIITDVEFSKIYKSVDRNFNNLIILVTEIAETVSRRYEAIDEYID
jgi:hypothetical protein